MPKNRDEGAGYRMHYLSADVGGTFIDLILFNPADRSMSVAKVSSTGAQADGILDGVIGLLERSGVAMDRMGRFVHGSTIATNAWLTQCGARVVFLVTEGCRDVLEIGTQRRATLYSLTQQRIPSLVPRSRVLEVQERLDAFGGVVQPLSEAETARVAAAVRVLEPEAVAISLLFSFLDNQHEHALAAVLRRTLPSVPVYLSTEINPQIEEYPRANTTVASAFVGPIIDHYLTALEVGLQQRGFAAPLALMRSDGGVATAEATRRNPATMLLSGPAGGVIAGADLSVKLGIPNLVTFDMGGTSADFSLIFDGTPRLSMEKTVDNQILRLPMLDIETISAGGGSIASIDHAGALHVGPQSAGSTPGPACYGLGGSEPTLTDAAVVLGLIDAQDFAGGNLKLMPEAAREAVALRVAEPLGLGVEDAALGMLSVACAQMRQAIRALSVERGHDIRRFSLLAFGGAGPIFAALMEPELGVEQVLVPPRPGVFAAFGLLMADIKHTMQAPFLIHIDQLTLEELRARTDAMTAALDAALERDGIPTDRRTFNLYADLRYAGQFHDITVPLAGRFDRLRWEPGGLVALFHRLHEQTYGHADEASAVEVVNVRAEGIGEVDKPDLPKIATRNGCAPRARRYRRVLLERGGEWHNCPVYRRGDLAAGDRLDGPATVSQSDTTILILPAQSGHVDAYGVIHIRSRGSDA